MIENVNNTIEEAISKGWKRIYLQGCGLKEVPQMLSEIDGLELVDLRGNKLTKIPEWLNLDIDFTSEKDTSKLNTVYLHGNHFISNQKNDPNIIIKSEKVSEGLIEMIKGNFEDMIQKIPIIIEDIDENGKSIFIAHEESNAWENAVVFQIEEQLILLENITQKNEIHIFVEGHLESEWFLYEIFKYIYSIDLNYGVISHLCPIEVCQLRCSKRFIFDFIYIKDFQKKYIPKIQCFGSGNHLRLDAFFGAKQPNVNIFIDYAGEDSNEYKEFRKHFPRKGWDFDTAIWSPEKILPGAHSKNDYDHNFRSSEVLIFLISSDYLSNESSLELFEGAKTRMHTDKILMLVVEIKSIHWKDLLKNSYGDEFPEEYTLEGQNWYELSDKVTKKIEKYLKNKIKT